MIAVDEDRPAARSFGLLNESVLTVAGIYGPNASGKSNVVDALAWLSTAINKSLRAWDEVVPREPFKFRNAAGRSTSFEVEMIVGGVRYAYQLELSDNEVSFEALYSYPERRRRLLFEREGLEVQFRRGLASTLSGVRELLTPTTLALSAAIRFNEPEVSLFGRKVANILVLGARPRRPRYSGYYAPAPYRAQETERLFLDGPDPDQLELFEGGGSDEFWGPRSALALLRFADLGIENVEVVEEPSDETVDSSPRRKIRLVHRVADQKVVFSAFDESEGTRTWFRLIGPVLGALRNGRTLLFDEIDASLHPRLSAKLLELFRDPKTNPRGAQLIFTSHDTSLLNHLNRDEVWLTEKGDDGATSLTALADFGGDKVRRSLNLEKAYLQGRFGAVPELDQHAIRSLLGLIPQDEP
ncbi:ATP/GTP-binding protein [Cryptosporangium sp. NPDC051539]|uniref:ATP/GTP-binding protein n=1 Tax=Cryptosporangium sp. NPDC051539 TaxID=3363962 RepID=UPI0037A355A7